MVSVDHPNVEITAWQANHEAVKHFDPTCKETRKVYEGPVTLQFIAKTLHETAFSDAHVHISYYQDAQKGMVQETFSLSAERVSNNQVATAVAIDGTVEQATALSMPLPSKQATSAAPLHGHHAFHHWLKLLNLPAYALY